MKELENKTGYPKAIFFILISTLLTGILTLVGGTTLLVDLLGFVFPAYQSFKSIDSGSKDDTQWLTYWVVFSAMTITESVAGFLTNLIPFYLGIKCAIIVWMWYPTTNGAKVIYVQVLRPLLLPYLEAGSSTKKAE